MTLVMLNESQPGWVGLSHSTVSLYLAALQREQMEKRACLLRIPFPISNNLAFSELTSKAA